MPAQSKSQQRFFGVVKAMQKGDIPKKGKAGKIAKQMSKDDVDDFASTKHKGKPEKVKQETKVRQLIRKMVRETMTEIDEAAKRDYKAEYKKFQSSTKSKKYRAELNKYNRQKGTYGNGDGKDASHKGGKIVGFEAESKNRGRAEKSRLKKEGKLNEKPKVQRYVVGLDNGEVMSGDKSVTEKRALQIMSRISKRSDGWVNPFMIGVEAWNGTHPKSKGKPHKMNKKKIMVKEGLDLKKLETAIKDFQNKIKKQGRVTNARDEEHLKQLIKVYKQMGGRKIKEACQKGYKTHPTRKTKEMFGKRYRNCIKAEDKLKEGSDTFVNILNKFGFKKGARDWGGHQFFVHKSKDLYATYNPSGRSIVIEPKRGGKPVFDSARSNFSIRALLNYLQSPKNKFVSTEGKLTESQQVAKTILQQLGGNRFIAMTGAKNFGSSRNSLQFKIGRNSKSISHVIITLKSSDLYDVEFIRMRGTSRKVVKKVKGVYADQLGTMFKKYTGMNVRL